MSDYPSKTPEEPKGIGSIIRVVFKGSADGDVETIRDATRSSVRVVFEGPVDCDTEVFYVGVAPRRWAEYGGYDVDEFTWEQMLQIIWYDEAAVFEVVYEGFGAVV